MIDRAPGSGRLFSWALVGGWALLIYTTTPLARVLVDEVSARGGRRGLGWLVIVLGALAVVAGVRAMRRLGRVSPWRWLAVAAIAGMFGLETLSRMRHNLPEEALHLVEYGVLGALCLRLLGHRLRDRLVYPAAILLATIFGVVDEVVQWLVPERYFDFADIRLNGYGAALAVAAIVAAGPRWVQGWATRRSLAVTCQLGVVLIVLLGLCLANTPPRVERYGERLPALGFLRGNPSVMNEYGYRHGDDQGPWFYSRLSLEELARADGERWREAALILDGDRHGGGYGAFLARYSPGVDPFLHEARVHLFRRDRYIWIGRELDRAVAAAALAPSPAEILDRRRTVSVAYGEQVILERHFGRTLGASSYVLGDADRAYLDDNVLRDEPYTSAVSDKLLHRLREWQVLAILATLGGLLLVLPRWLGRRLSEGV